MAPEPPQDAQPAGSAPPPPPPSRQRPRGAVDRVAQVHRQARPTFVVSALFAMAAPISAVVPHGTGIWLPLHLFLVGAVLGAIMAATQLLAVTWSASPAPAFWMANLQRGLLFGGVVLIVLGREASIDALTGVGGTAVIAALMLLIVSLLQIRAHAVTDRYGPAIIGYCLAAGFGIIGSALGTAIAAGAFADIHDRVRSIHLTVNVLGLVGLVIASTLPYFVATQARMKMSSTATPTRVLLVIAALTSASSVAVLGWVLDIELISALGLWAYSVGLIALLALMPHVGRKQLDWAGPRLVQLAAGFAWWIVSVALLGTNALTDSPHLNTALKVLVVGGYAQILFASLAYFAPVILAGKRKPGDGLRLTRSWVAVAGANVAAIGALVDLDVVLFIGIAIWVVEGLARTVRLGRFASVQARSGAIATDPNPRS